MPIDVFTLSVVCGSRHTHGEASRHRRPAYSNVENSTKIEHIVIRTKALEQHRRLAYSDGIPKLVSLPLMHLIDAGVLPLPPRMVPQHIVKKGPELRECRVLCLR